MKRKDNDALTKENRSLNANFGTLERIKNYIAVSLPSEAFNF